MANAFWGLLGLVGVPPDYAWLQPYLVGAAVLMGVLFVWRARSQILTKIQNLLEKTNPSATGQVSNPYLSNVNEELGFAIFRMATCSAWGRWFASRYIADNKSMPQEKIIRTASYAVLEALLDGKLSARGRLPDKVEYESISREAWRLVWIQMQPHPLTLWKAVLVPRTGIPLGRVLPIMEYNSVVINSGEFETLWPRKDRKIDKAIKINLKKARKNGMKLEDFEGLGFGFVSV